VAGRENGPHVGAQGVDRTLEVLQPRRGDGGARKPRIHVVQQFAQGHQLLGKRLVGHMEILVSLDMDGTFSTSVFCNSALLTSVSV
jgi:hypothetical protein